MSTIPADPDIVNTKALESFMRAFDCALVGKYDLSGGAMTSVPPPTVRAPQRERRQEPHLGYWHTLPFLKAIIRFRDNVRLRRYNREWIKNNIH